MPTPQSVQRKGMDRADSARKSPHKVTRRHIMPGLVPLLVQTFRTPRQYNTIRAVEEDTKLPGGIVASGLIHELFDRVEHIERQIAGREEGLSVRDFRVLKGRVA